LISSRGESSNFLAGFLGLVVDQPSLQAIKYFPIAGRHFHVCGSNQGILPACDRAYHVDHRRRPSSVQRRCQMGCVPIRRKVLLNPAIF
jgi:hypothetical protein